MTDDAITEIERLKDLADPARRLANAMTDPDLRRSLAAYASQCDEEALKLAEEEAAGRAGPG